MSSTGVRPPNPDRRPNGAFPPDRAASSSRPRMTAAHESFRSDRSDPRFRDPSPQASSAGTSHQRTASGNPRPASRAAEERRTEKVLVATRETLVARTRSPDRRSAPAPKDKAKAADGG